MFEKFLCVLPSSLSTYNRGWPGARWPFLRRCNPLGVMGSNPAITVTLKQPASPAEKLRAPLKPCYFWHFPVLASLLLLGGIWYSVWPTLPDVESLRNVELQTPLRIYTRDRKLIREFGEKRRVPLTIAELPPAMKSAVIDTEDRNFYQHAGVDPLGIARAVIYLLREGRKGPGGSTITMQVARNFSWTGKT